MGYICTNTQTWLPANLLISGLLRDLSLFPFYKLFNFQELDSCLADLDNLTINIQLEPLYYHPVKRSAEQVKDLQIQSYSS